MRTGRPGGVRRWGIMRVMLVAVFTVVGDRIGANTGQRQHRRRGAGSLVRGAARRHGRSVESCAHREDPVGRYGWSGAVRIVDLRPGTYSVVFTLPGFATVRREGLELTSGFTATVNAELKVGSIEETVTVSGASPVVDVQNFAQQNVLKKEELDTLPTFKNLQGIGVLTVGASTTGGHDAGGTRSEIYSSITIHGSKMEDARMDLDDMRYQNMWGYGGGLTRLWFLNSAIVQELVVETSGMSAEAENGGPVMNAVPKDGGNRFTAYANNTFSSNSMQNRNSEERHDSDVALGTEQAGGGVARHRSPLRRRRRTGPFGLRPEPGVEQPAGDRFSGSRWQLHEPALLHARSDQHGEHRQARWRLVDSSRRTRCTRRR